MCVLYVKRWVEASQTQLKKVKKLFAANQRKLEKSKEKLVSSMCVCVCVCVCV